MKNKSQLQLLSYEPGMVDVSKKNITERIARASGVVELTPKAFKILIKKGSPKGNVLETSKIAGIMAVKKTSEIIPLCHPLDISKVKVTFEHDHKKSSIKIYAEVVSLGRTGVEMEALTAVSVAALTIYDMMKWADQNIKIGEISLDYKSGGKMGIYQRSKLK